MRASTALSLHQKYLERIAARQKQLASKLSNNRQTKEGERFINGNVVSSLTKIEEERKN
jgi:hypothetical protein